MCIDPMYEKSQHTNTRKITHRLTLALPPHLPSLDDSMDGAGLGLSHPDLGEGLGLSHPPSLSSSSPPPLRPAPLGIGVGVAVVACAQARGTARSTNVVDGRLGAVFSSVTINQGG